MGLVGDRNGGPQLQVAHETRLERGSPGEVPACPEPKDTAAGPQTPCPCSPRHRDPELVVTARAQRHPELHGQAPLPCKRSPCTTGTGR